jgi:hypothetical protein
MAVAAGLEMHCKRVTMSRQLAYCTNVHAGADLEQTVANLDQYALAVKRRFAPSEPMGIGLWFASPAAKSLISEDRLAWLANWLAGRGLQPFTLNGFPFGDFHQPVVKHRVYEPTWKQNERVDYTLNLVDILHSILPAGLEGSISTLPIAWGIPPLTPDDWQQAAAHLLHVVDYLADLEERQGRLIYLCLEPEPGCALSVSDDLVTFFQRYLFSRNDAEKVLRYLRVCHDVCHAAVMFEGQQQVLEKYRQAGIRVGKVQVSSAIRVDFSLLEPDDRRHALEQLGSFAEDRYLHQTSIRRPDEARPQFYEDLTAALNDVQDARQLRSEWRVHFHVPIYLERFGWIGTSRDEIPDCLTATQDVVELKHFEVETYAWGVLPAELQQEKLADGIAREMSWLATLPEFNV